MLVVYHCSCPLKSRLAAGIHAGRLSAQLPGRRELSAAIRQLAADSETTMDLIRGLPGLRVEGPDQAGALVLAMGTGAPAWLTAQALGDFQVLLGARLPVLSCRLDDLPGSVQMLADVLADRPFAQGLRLRAALLAWVLRKAWVEAAAVAMRAQGLTAAGAHAAGVHAPAGLRAPAVVQ